LQFSFSSLEWNRRAFLRGTGVWGPGRFCGEEAMKLSSFRLERFKELGASAGGLHKRLFNDAIGERKREEGDEADGVDSMSASEATGVLAAAYASM